MLGNVLSYSDFLMTRGYVLDQRFIGDWSTTKLDFTCRVSLAADGTFVLTRTIDAGEIFRIYKRKGEWFPSSDPKSIVLNVSELKYKRNIKNVETSCKLFSQEETSQQLFSSGSCEEITSSEFTYESESDSSSSWAPDKGKGKEKVSKRPQREHENQINLELLDEPDVQEGMWVPKEENFLVTYHDSSGESSLTLYNSLCTVDAEGTEKDGIPLTRIKIVSSSDLKTYRSKVSLLQEMGFGEEAITLLVDFDGDLERVCEQLFGR
eukprot:TRINITY_DN4883_c0_g1_i12.p1 TRINITY_DN4883_c0_g1~~TRINITY_DN4883_c0_g1_i12.p1  ORF type:complete len:265 (+),score=49.85 TRINITY_DN4883_c0_g1_i12:147-941(+)